jgi:hypothetical protein
MNVQFKETTDHDEIRRWAECLGGKPQLWDGVIGVRIDFPGGIDDDFIPADHQPRDVGWDDFFRLFDDRHLIFEYCPEASDCAGKSLLYRFKPRFHS